MQMDVSHMNEKAFWDTAHHSTSPLVATHSNAHALCPQPRNLTDQQLRAIRDSGGVVGVNFGNAFLRADGRRDSDTPLTTIVRHIDYLINIMGEDHVALGSDFDGITLPDELGDVAGLPRLINTLRASGYDQLVLDKLLWRNWLRVLKMFGNNRLYCKHKVNSLQIPVDLSPGEAQYAAAVTDPPLSVRPVVIFKRNKTCGRNLLLSIYVSVWK